MPSLVILCIKSPVKVVQSKAGCDSSLMQASSTDFLSVELACMRLLSHPAFDCTTFTGDLMQRMTSEGIKSWDEIGDLVNPAPEIHHLKLVYMQSPKLLQIAKSPIS